MGVPVDVDPTPTLALALRLQPRARRLVLITGSSPWDKRWEARLRKAVRAFQDTVDIAFWAGWPMTAITQRLKSLPADTIIFSPAFFRDGAGQVFIPRNAIERMAAVATVPLYGIYDSMLGSGVIGGYMATFETLGWETGHIVVRLLNGETPATLELPAVAANQYIFDGRQLRRWGIDEAALPAGSQIRFQEPTFWQAYRESILLTLGLLLLQTVFIGGLLFERRSRRRVTAELQESKKSMQLATEAAGLGLWIWNIDHHTVWASSQTRQMYGFEPAEPLRFDRFLSVLHAADREPVQQAIRKVLAGHQDLNIEYRVVHPKGTVRWMAARGQREWAQNGRPHRLLGISMDITENKEAELRTKQHRNELLHLSRVNMLGHFSGSLAHELNQPLTAILSNAQAARRRLALNPIDLKELQEILGDIVDEDQRAAEIIRRLRRLFNRGEVQWQSIDMNRLMSETLKLIHSDLVIQGMTPIIQLAADLPTVQGDPVPLQQVLLNLITNAVDAMVDTPPGERQLTIRTEAIDQSSVRVSVMDRGHGIDAGQRDRIFEPFFTTKRHGMGMGLAISQSILAAHGSSLAVSNNPDRGTTLSFVLSNENNRNAT